MTVSNNHASGYRGEQVNLLDFFPFYSPSDDHTAGIIWAFQSADSEGFDLFVPSGEYNYDAPLGNLRRNLIGASKGTVNFNNYGDTVIKKGARIDITADNVEVSGITFRVINTPPTARNDADEHNIVLRATGVSNITIDSCDFTNCYGAAVLYRSVHTGWITNSRIFTCFKDGFHITGDSTDITRMNCLVENGGDDAFAVVGTSSTGTIGQPDGIIDIGLVVRGVKFGRGVAYVGCKNVKARSIKVDGFVPAKYGVDNKVASAAAGLIIYVDSAVNSYGNEHISVDGIEIRNCGRALNGNVYGGAVQIGSGSGKVTDDIRITDLKVYNSIRRAVFVNGGSAAGITNLRINDFFIEDTTDITGIEAVVAGTGSNHGIEIQNTKDISLTGKVKTAGGGAAYLSNVEGTVTIDISTNNINKSGTAGVDIINLASNSNPAKISVKLTADQPSIVSASNPHFIDRIVDLSNVNNIGKIDKLEVNHTGTLNKISLLPVPSTQIVVGTSPFTWTNQLPYHVLVDVRNGAVTSISKGKTLGISAPQYASQSATSGEFYLEPGDSIVTSFTTPPSMQYSASRC